MMNAFNFKIDDIVISKKFNHEGKKFIYRVKQFHGYTTELESPGNKLIWLHDREIDELYEFYCRYDENLFRTMPTFLGEDTSSEVTTKICITHNWKMYSGFIETFEYCKDCGVKKNG